MFTLLRSLLFFKLRLAMFVDVLNSNFFGNSFFHIIIIITKDLGI